MRSVRDAGLCNGFVPILRNSVILLTLLLQLGSRVLLLLSGTILDKLVGHKRVVELEGSSHSSKTNS